MTIDEEFEDSEEFVLALENAIEEEDAEHSEEPLETDVECEKVQFELANEVQDFWNCDDVISKLVKDQKEKDAKALVLWQPRVTFPSDNPSDSSTDSEETSEPKKPNETVLDCTSEYTVTEEASDDSFEVDPRTSDLKLEISEWIEDEDMMEA